MRGPFTSFLLAAALALPACIMDTGKGDMPPPSDADSGEDRVDGVDGEDGEQEQVVTPADICAEAFEVMCGYIDQCCSPSDKEVGAIVIYRLYVGSDCTDPESSQLYRECLTGLEQSLELGRSAIDPSGIAGCRATLEAIVGACPNFNILMRSQDVLLSDYCSDALIGLVEEGGQCSTVLECVEDLVCSYDGECAEAIPPGESCDRNDLCARGTTCLPFGFCGEPGSSGDPCVEDPDCSLFYFCPTGGIVCTPLLGDGEPCAEGKCGGVCVGDVCKDTCDGF
ncbi:MAG: hypothetical protein ABIJ56_04175 [Pseudomonadota bacterium]